MIDYYCQDIVSILSVCICFIYLSFIYGLFYDRDKHIWYISRIH